MNEKRQVNVKGITKSKTEKCVREVDTERTNVIKTRNINKEISYTKKIKGSDTKEFIYLLTKKNIDKL